MDDLQAEVARLHKTVGWMLLSIAAICAYMLLDLSDKLGKS